MGHIIHILAIMFLISCSNKNEQKGNDTEINSKTEIVEKAIKKLILPKLKNIPLNLKIG